MKNKLAQLQNKQRRSKDKPRNKEQKQTEKTKTNEATTENVAKFVRRVQKEITK